MKIVVVADVHLHPWRLQSRDGGYDRLMDGLSVLEQSLDLAEREGALWVMAGDFKQPKTIWPQSALTGAHEILRRHDKIDKVMVAGNHDARSADGGTGLAPFRDCAQVIEKTSLGFACNSVPVFIGMPWDGDKEKMRELQSHYPKLPLVAHGFLAGCMLGTEDTRIAKGARVEEYGDFPVAFFGDVHKGQWRRPADPGRGTPPTWEAYPSVNARGHECDPTLLVRRPGPWAGEVMYAGSPYMQNWGERDDPPKGALLADLATGEVRLVPLRSPRYVHLDVSTEADLEAFMARRKEYAGDFVRVVYSGPGSMVLGAARQIGEEFRSYQITVRRPDKSTRRADVHAGMSTPDMLKNYVAARPPAEGMNAAMTLEAGLRLVEGRT